MDGLRHASSTTKHPLENLFLSSTPKRHQDVKKKMTLACFEGKREKKIHNKKGGEIKEQPNLMPFVKKTCMHRRVLVLALITFKKAVFSDPCIDERGITRLQSISAYDARGVGDLIYIWIPGGVRGKKSRQQLLRFHFFLSLSFFFLSKSVCLDSVFAPCLVK